MLYNYYFQLGVHYVAAIYADPATFVGLTCIEELARSEVPGWSGLVVIGTIYNKKIQSTEVQRSGCSDLHMRISIPRMLRLDSRWVNQCFDFTSPLMYKLRKKILDRLSLATERVKI